MSFDALAWAAKQSPGSSGAKLVLLGLAECADRVHSLAFPSIAALVEFSCLDRKSVITNLGKLEAAGLISDTGRKVGQTKQIKVYKLNLETVPKTEPSPKRNSSENDSNSPENGTRNLSEPVKTEAKASFTALCDRFFDEWNAAADRSGFKRAVEMDHSRKQSFRLRVKQYGEERVFGAIKLAEQASWLKGEGRDTKWRPDMDFFLKPAKLRKILEGSYGEDAPPTRQLDRDQQREKALGTAAFYDKIGRGDEAEAIRLKWSGAQPLGAIAAKILEGVRPQ